jgi:DNA-binding NarL/FixJ family response regulator
LARAALAKVARFDSFYVGLLHGHRKVRYPYGYEDGRFDDSTILTVGPYGQTAWLLQHRRTYRFAYDGGAVLNAGVSFGDTHRQSADAVTVPLIRSKTNGDDSVFGMISMHSYTSGAFTDEAVRAAEWLGTLLARWLTRRDEDRTVLAQLDIADDHDTLALTSDRVIDYLSRRIGEVRQLAADLDPAEPEVHAGLSRIARACEQMQVDLIEMTNSVDSGPQQRFQALTPAEQSVALLVADGMSNQQIAREFGVSLNTAKTHLASIRRKYAMTERTEIGSDVRRALG